MRLTPALAVLGTALAAAACTQHKVEVEPTHHTIAVEPIYLTIDLNIKVQRELEDFFEPIEAGNQTVVPTGPSAANTSPSATPTPNPTEGAR